MLNEIVRRLNGPRPKIPQSLERGALKVAGGPEGGRGMPHSRICNERRRQGAGSTMASDAVARFALEREWSSRKGQTLLEKGWAIAEPSLPARRLSAGPWLPHASDVGDSHREDLSHCRDPNFFLTAAPRLRADEAITGPDCHRRARRGAKGSNARWLRAMPATPKLKMGHALWRAVLFWTSSSWRFAGPFPRASQARPLTAQPGASPRRGPDARARLPHEARRRLGTQASGGRSL